MNKFDQALSGYDEQLGLQGLDGFFKSLKKKVKKLAKNVKKVAVKVKNKLPKPIEKFVDKVGDSPITKAVALAGAAYVAGPAVLSAAKGGVAMGSKLLGKMAIKKTMLGAAKKAVVGKALSPQQKQNVKEEATAIKEESDQVGFNLGNTLKTIVSNPAFQGVAQQMIATGQPPAKAIREWTQSRYYQQAAQVAAADAVTPIVYRQAINQGFPPVQAEAAASAVALKTGKEAAQKIAGMNPIVLVALIPLGMLAIKGMQK